MTTRQPQTAAGRTFLDALSTQDRLNGETVRVDWAHGILAIEAAAKAEGAREAVERVRARLDRAMQPYGEIDDMYRDEILAILQDERESSLGRDAEGRLALSLGPGAESPSRKGERPDLSLTGDQVETLTRQVMDMVDPETGILHLEPLPDVITGYADPSGKGEGNWSELDDLSPLEQWNKDANR